MKRFVQFSIGVILLLTLMAAFAFQGLVFYSEKNRCRDVDLGSATVTVQIEKFRRRMSFSVRGTVLQNSRIERRLGLVRSLVQDELEKIASGPNPIVLLSTPSLQRDLLSILHDRGYKDFLLVSAHNHHTEWTYIVPEKGVLDFVAKKLNDFASVIIKGLGLRLTYDQRKKVEHTIKQILSSGCSYVDAVRD